MRVMACESNGVPFAENSRSGAAGLFQNLPYYWQSRVDRVRAYHSDKSNILRRRQHLEPGVQHHDCSTPRLGITGDDSRQSQWRRSASPAVWPEFNWERFATSGYGYS